jgi:hypothetical protein
MDLLFHTYCLQSHWTLASSFGTDRSRQTWTEIHLHQQRDCYALRSNICPCYLMQMLYHSLRKDLGFRLLVSSAITHTTPAA